MFKNYSQPSSTKTPMPHLSRTNKRIQNVPLPFFPFESRRHLPNTRSAAAAATVAAVLLLCSRGNNTRCGEWHFLHDTHAQTQERDGETPAKSEVKHNAPPPAAAEGQTQKPLQCTVVCEIADDDDGSQPSHHSLYSALFHGLCSGSSANACPSCSLYRSTIFSLTHIYTHSNAAMYTHTYAHTHTHTLKRFARRCLRARARSPTVCAHLCFLIHTLSLTYIVTVSVKKRKPPMRMNMYVIYLRLNLGDYTIEITPSNHAQKHTRAPPTSNKFIFKP